MFRQELHEGFQHENPDYWLNFGNPWEIQRPNITYPVKFYGHVTIHDVEGRQAFDWKSGEEAGVASRPRSFVRSFVRSFNSPTA